VSGWWERRRLLQARARRLTAEFSGSKGVRYRVKAHGGRSLELLVWPEGGLDNYVEKVASHSDIDRASDEFRRLVALYGEGKRPPFGD